MKQPTLWVGVVLCVLSLGCATRSDLTAVSSKNVNVSSLRLDPERSKGRAYGEDCTHTIIIIPTGGEPTIDEAIDRALESKGASVLTDAVVRYEYFYIPLVYGKTCWKAEGDAYDTFE